MVKPVKSSKNKADDVEVMACNQGELNGILYIVLRQMGMDGSINDEGGRKQIVVDERAFVNLPKKVQIHAQKIDGKIYLHAGVTEKEKKQLKKQESKLFLPKRKALVVPERL